MADLSAQLSKDNLPQHVFFFDSDSANTFFSRYINKHSSQSGNIGLFFSVLDIVNVSDKPCTIKDVILKYDLEGKTYSTISTVLQTGYVENKEEKNDSIRLKVLTRNGIDTIYLIGWKNIRTKIGERKVLTPGSVLNGSALFVLEIDKVEKVKHIKNMEIIIKDFSGNTTEQPIEILERWIETAKDTVVQSETFRHISK